MLRSVWAWLTPTINLPLDLLTDTADALAAGPGEAPAAVPRPPRGGGGHSPMMGAADDDIGFISDMQWAYDVLHEIDDAAWYEDYKPLLWPRSLHFELDVIQRLLDNLAAEVKSGRIDPSRIVVKGAP